MADTAAPPARTRGGGRGRGGQSRGRGRGADSQSLEGQTGDTSSGRGGRRGGRGTNRGVDGNRLPQSATVSDAVVQTKLKQEKQSEDKLGADDVEAEVCFICASPVVHNSVAPCNHRTCHICALRMRALYKTKDCAHCRVLLTWYIFAYGLS